MRKVDELLPSQVVPAYPQQHALEVCLPLAQFQQIFKDDSGPLQYLTTGLRIIREAQKVTLQLSSEDAEILLSLLQGTVNIPSFQVLLYTSSAPWKKKRRKEEAALLLSSGWQVRICKTDFCMKAPECSSRSPAACVPGSCVGLVSPCLSCTLPKVVFPGFQQAKIPVPNDWTCLLRMQLMRGSSASRL